MSLHAADPFDWIGPILEREKPLSIASQRQLSEVLAGPEASGEWRERIVRAFAGSVVRDAQTALNLLIAYDRAGNQAWLGSLALRLEQASRQEVLGFWPQERPAIEGKLIALANSPGGSLFARRLALRVLAGIGISRASVAHLGPLTAFSTQELKPLFHSRPERSAFAQFWLSAEPDLRSFRAILADASQRMPPTEFQAGLVSVLGHPVREVRALAAEVLETALRADTAFAAPLLPSEHGRLYEFYLRFGSAPYLAWRFARNDEERAAILDRIERTGDLHAREEVARALRWEKGLDSADDVPEVRLRADALLAGCRGGHAALIRK